MDVYENERDLFFEDKSNDVIRVMFPRLSACHNVHCLRGASIPDREALIGISGNHVTKQSQQEGAKPARAALFTIPVAPLRSRGIFE